MTEYNTDYIKSAMPFIFEYDQTPAKETSIDPDMPRAAADPRKANDAYIGMIDVRRAWKHCPWPTYEERQAVLAVALCDTYELAGFFTGVPVMTIHDRERRGLELLAQWMNSSHAEREEWDRQLERELRDKKYKPAFEPAA